MTAAEARTLSGAAAYGHDSYQPGETVLILADSLDGQMLEPPPIAQGTIRCEAAVGTEEVTFFEVSRCCGHMWMWR
jgi:hypothetical protein